MQNYELLFVVPGTMSEDEVSPIVEKVKKAVLDNAGVNWGLETMEKRRLAYPMKHIRYGYFYLAFFQAEAEAVVKMRNELRLMPEMLRALVTKFDPEKQKIRRIEFGTTPTPGIEVVKNTVETLAMEAAANVGPTVVAAPEAVERIVEPVQEEKVSAKKIKKPMDLAEIDKKLDEILDLDLTNV
ncbi:MAG: 30S ribosomal protein S6 [Candidatus Magasanikbacteria bacterium RIFCSPLOWO2_01_FULL_43_20b]|nr:MAG: 30S ribosomal protein S6 [Candidatus Magasanikbacteria bacterium RIFCSPHIGHO2_02_FULL_44_13]OGH72987.1 MAG: 30S ribosomal protein S6 [Candidatus Magasanikbacteria bacterium RIFCSPLOWO2_01_FULL_43_20b]